MEGNFLITGVVARIKGINPIWFYGGPSVRLSVSVFSMHVSSCISFNDLEGICWNFRNISKRLIGKYMVRSGHG
jgi:hypothetical protein